MFATHLEDPSETVRKAARDILLTSGRVVQLGWSFWMNWTWATCLVSARTPTWVRVVAHVRGLA